MYEMDNRIYDAAFRELYHKLIYIDCPDEMGHLAEYIPVAEGAMGVMAYGFVEDGTGLNLYLICSAVHDRESESLSLGRIAAGELCRIRYSDATKYVFINEEDLPLDADVIKRLRSSAADHTSGLESQNDLHRMLYDLDMVDSSRHIEFPHFFERRFSAP